MGSEDNREQQICKAWAGEADRADKLEALCRQLVLALGSWKLFDTESADKHPCPDLILRNQYRKNARELTESVLTDARKAGIKLERAKK